MKEGVRLGKYRIVRQMEPFIWLAERMEDFDQNAAVVFVPEIPSPNDEGNVRERRRKLASLDHPVIPRFLDAGESAGGLPYNLFEWMPNEALLAVARAEKWKLARRLTVALQHLDGLALAHRNLLAHGGLTTNSFRVMPAGQARIALFPATEAPGDSVEADLRAAVEFLSRLTAESGIEKLPRDIEAIVDKGRELESRRGYSSVDGLARDLRAYLEHRPVSARPAAPLHGR